jgi:hypothetical protein
MPALVILILHDLDGGVAHEHAGPVARERRAAAHSAQMKAPGIVAVRSRWPRAPKEQDAAVVAAYVEISYR